MQKKDKLPINVFNDYIVYGCRFYEPRNHWEIWVGALHMGNRIARVMPGIAPHIYYIHISVEQGIGELKRVE